MKNRVIKNFQKVSPYIKRKVKVPVGSYLLVANYNEDTISVIKTTTYEVMNTIFVGDRPYEIILGPDKKFAFVINQKGNLVLIIDTTNFKVMR